MNYECENCGNKNENVASDSLIVVAGAPVEHEVTCKSCGTTSVLRVSLSTSNEKYRDESWLRLMYTEREMSMAAIAEMCGVSPMTIFGWLKRHEIKTRRRGQR